PLDEAQASVWKQLAEGELASPDTWEVALSAGANKCETFERLLRENRLGALAVLRNLRYMAQSGVDEKLVKDALRALNTSRVLPFRFIAAARYAPQWEAELEAAMFRSVETAVRLPGKTVLVVDVSGSMTAPLSARSEMQRTDTAYGLAILLREIAEELAVFSFSDRCVRVPSRRGFALRDAIDASQVHGSTYLGRALEEIREAYDRLIVITDEQSHDCVPDPQGKGYMINVASYKNGVGYGVWTHIDGWSESVIGYIRELESMDS
ncbi:MAG: TROVE domain-containing protein, partial [Terriglobales bacterium]